MWFRRERDHQWSDENLCRYGMTGNELNQLSQYNAERHRGIMHTDEYSERMAELQRRFDEGHGR